MEEVDKILILTLNHLGCDIDEEMKTVGSFGIEKVVGGVVRCLHAICSDCDLPTSLPQNMAQRFRAAAAIAQAVKDTGYPGDIGYQSLLYPSEADLHRIFMFLIEKLPRDSSPVSDEPINKATLIHREAKKKVSEALSQPWIPPHCRHIVRKNSSHASLTKYGTAHTQGFTSKPFRGYEDPSQLSTVQHLPPHCLTVLPRCLTSTHFLIASAHNFPSLTASLSHLCSLPHCLSSTSPPSLPHTLPATPLT
ncbi:hypothetical protein O3P69_020298 [Scylla paramamosain]|uniref:CCDC22 N-terminal domain-containing protein n=1 Tax=Scylla paramamosain TaxID=85552 RepID=A0AAW0SIK1_SCYPA